MRTSVSSLLKEYFDAGTARHHPLDFSIDTRSLPVIANSKSKWYKKENPECLCRNFEFKSRGETRAFIDEILNHEDQCGHHGEIQVSGLNVSVEIFTHNLNSVTNLDKEYANDAERIYNDVCAYGYR